MCDLGLASRLEGCQGLIDLSVESIGILDEMEDLGVVEFQQHTSDLACKCWLTLLDAHVQMLAKHSLLLLSRGRSKGLGIELGHLTGCGCSSCSCWSRGCSACTSLVLLALVDHSWLELHATLLALALLALTTLRTLGTTSLAAATALVAVLTLHLNHLWVDELATRRHALREHEHLSWALLWTTWARWVEHRHVAVGHHVQPLHVAEALALSELLRQLSTADLTGLVESDVDGLASKELSVHSCHSLGCLIRGLVADEAEALRIVLLVDHHLG